jgi:hypothetical protein
VTAYDRPQVAPDPGRVTRAEVALLAALLFVLPLFEVPKHLLWLAWVWVSAAGWWRERAARRAAGLAVPPWGLWDSAFAALLASALLAGLGVAEPVRTLGAAGDSLRLLAVPWLMSRRRYRLDQIVPVLWAAVAGTLLATVWGFVELLRAAGPVFFELNSVGQVNHSSIYLAIAFGCALALVLADPVAGRSAWRWRGPCCSRSRCWSPRVAPRWGPARSFSCCWRRALRSPGPIRRWRRDAAGVFESACWWSYWRPPAPIGWPSD